MTRACQVPAGPCHHPFMALAGSMVCACWSGGCRSDVRYPTTALAYRQRVAILARIDSMEALKDHIRFERNIMNDKISGAPSATSSRTLDKQSSEKVCPFCAETIKAAARVCRYCGRDILEKDPKSGARNISEADSKPVSDKRVLPVLLLCLFFGGFGAHAFYAGNSKQGLALFFCFSLFWMGIISSPSSIEFGWIILVCELLGFAAGIFLLSDLISIVFGVYKDGKGHKINQWT